MSGWENIPEKTPPAPAKPRRAKAPAADVSGAPPSPPESEPIADGDWIRIAEWYFPALWLAMLLIVCFIGVYSAVGKLPNSPW
jgi:hypothetical protein